jgi:hypothetical protein
VPLFGCQSLRLKSLQLPLELPGLALQLGLQKADFGALAACTSAQARAVECARVGQLHKP